MENIMLIILDYFFEESHPTCKVKIGPGSGLPCTFPFKFNGNVFHGCTSYGSNRAWCQTRIQPFNGYGYLDGWGFCEDDCPLDEAIPTGKSKNLSE